MPAISVITIAEVGAGARTQAEQSDNTAFWRALHVYPVSKDIAERAGVFIRHFGKSHAVELADALIAATAEHHGLPLATLNIKHFPMFARLRAPY
jgi:predicted nucleic acid-binding protein